MLYRKNKIDSNIKRRVALLKVWEGKGFLIRRYLSKDAKEEASQLSELWRTSIVGRDNSSCKGLKGKRL